MLEIVEAGQAGKTKLLLDMHRLRKRVFKDRMGWDVYITPGGLEVDDFDLPNAVYLLATDEGGNVIGNWRLLPTTGPTMIREVWPQFLSTIFMTKDEASWEASRFAVDSLKGESAEGIAQVSTATQELFCGLTELCLLCGIEEIFTMYDMRIARLLKRLDCRPYSTSARLPIDEHASEVGCFKTDQQMLQRLRKATGITHPLITIEMLPPTLRERVQRNVTVFSAALQHSLQEDRKV